MKTASSFLLLMLALKGGVPVVQSLSNTYMVHGSGGTVPEACYSNIFERFTEQAKLPLRITYRSTGSSTGIKEFVNNYGDPIVDFASGETTVSSNDYEEFQQRNVTILHLPTVFGAVSFYHSLPLATGQGLNLTACLLSRILTRDIIDWTHPDIVKDNPSLVTQLSKDRNWPIRVARRAIGSGQTKAVTQYLNKACPMHFPPDMVGSAPQWPSDTVACRGASGVLNCILEEEGTIGYLDWRGNDAGLSEVSLTNKYGRTLNSQQAAYYGGIGVKENGILPNDPTMDFGQVSLLDQAGEFTWPIIVGSFIYIRLDLSFMPEPNERSLLIAFLKALYDPQFNEVCATEYKLHLAEGVSYDLAQKAIDMLEVHLTPEATPWTFEKNVKAIDGQGDFVISSTRNSLPQDERRNNHDEIERLVSQIELLQAKIDNMTSSSNDGGAAANKDHTHNDQQAVVVASLVVGCLGLLVALLAMYTSHRHIRRSNTLINDHKMEAYPETAATGQSSSLDIVDGSV